jgi:hypothetical protein
LDVISHAELLSLWKRGMRNGSLRRLPSIKRGLFSAAIDYSRIFGAIRNQELLRLLMGVADRIGKSLGQSIWDHGLRRALAQLRNERLRLIFPVKQWINDDRYVLWLGTNILNKVKWVTLPINHSTNAQ